MTDGGEPSVGAAVHATRAIPIVMGRAGDPVAAGLAASFARPGGTVTGFTFPALLQLASRMLLDNGRAIAERAMKYRLPGIFEWVRGDRALASYGPDVSDNFRRTAVYVDKILKGARPGELPVEQPAKFYLVINLGSAKALGLTIPREILSQATRIIE